jgi:hypothetical protein
MTNKMSYVYMRESLEYDFLTGNLIWLERPLHHFADKRAQKIVNTKHAGTIAGTLNNEHIAVNFKGKRYPAHVLVWFYAYGEWPELGIDHINNIHTDNRLENLRMATVRQNGYNSKKRKDNTAGYKGVKKRGNKFTARIMVNGHRIFLGTYDTPEEAHAAYCKAAKKYFGEFARFE